MLTIWALRIRQNAGWQRHVLFPNFKPTKKRCLCKTEIGVWQQTAAVPVHQSEKMTRAAV